MQGRIAGVCVSEHKGQKKINVGEARILAGWGLEGDAHAGYRHRQVSLLAKESIENMRQIGLPVGIGDYAENLTVEGINLKGLPLGTKLKIKNVVLKVSQIGKQCHDQCEVFKQWGDCIFPREGIFAIVEEGGIVRVGDVIEVIRDV